MLIVSGYSYLSSSHDNCVLKEMSSEGVFIVKYPQNFPSLWLVPCHWLFVFVKLGR